MCWVIFKEGEKNRHPTNFCNSPVEGHVLLYSRHWPAGRNRSGLKSHQVGFLVDGLGMSVPTLKWQERTWA